MAAEATGQLNAKRFFDSNSHGRLYVKLILKNGSAARYALALAGERSKKISNLTAEIAKLHSKFTGKDITLLKIWDENGFALHEKQEVWAVVDAESTVLATDSNAVNWTSFGGASAAEGTAVEAAATATKGKGTPAKKERQKRMPSEYNKFMGVRLKEIKKEHPSNSTTEIFSQVSKEWKTSHLNPKAAEYTGTNPKPATMPKPPAAVEVAPAKRKREVPPAKASTAESGSGKKKKKKNKGKKD